MRDHLTRRELLKAGLVGGVWLAAGASCLRSTASAPRHPSPIPSPAPTPPLAPWPEATDIIAQTVVPEFPSAAFVVTDSRYGAVADGRTDNTTAFKSAIEDCSAHGGGRVVVPAGTYLTGAVRLRSNVELHFEAGAIVNFSGDLAGYPLVHTRYAGIECVNYSPMIYAYGESNIALTGSGILDASATRSWNVGYDFTGILEPLVARNIPPEQRIVPQHGRLRSAFIEPYGCTNVLLQGITLRQSQFWQLHPTLCQNVTIDGVTTGGTTALNSDGCNPESCDHVVISNCTLDAADDCIAIKSGRDDDGRRVDRPCQNIVIHDCRLQGPVGGIAFGSEMTGGIRNVYAFDIRTYGTSVRYMLYVKSNTRRGGYAQNIHLDNVRADRLSGAWAYAQMDYTGQTGPYPPAFSDWFLSHVGGNSSPYALHLSGLAGDPIRHVEVSDSAFTGVTAPADYYSNVTEIGFNNVTINGSAVSS